MSPPCPLVGRATFDSSPRSEAVGTPQAAGLCSHLAHLWATSDSAPRSRGTHNLFLILLPALGVGDPRECRGDVSSLPSFAPPPFSFCPSYLQQCPPSNALRKALRQARRNRQQ